MKRAFFAGAVALAVLCVLPVATVQVQAAELSINGGMLTQVNVARIKAALKLTPDQQGYWPPIEVALRDIERQQSDSASNAGLFKRISHRVFNVVLNSAAAARLASAARPLVKILSDEQRQIAMSLAQEMGLGPMLAAL